MKQYSITGKDLIFNLSSSSPSVTEGEEFSITLTVSGSDAISGLKIPYSIGKVDFIDPSLNVVKRVSPKDYNLSQSEGVFTLDNSLSSTLSFVITKDKYNEPTEAFILGLTLTPNVKIVVLINNFIVDNPELIVPEAPIEPKIYITPVNVEITEGDLAEFRIDYVGIRHNLKIKYEFLDTKDVSQSEYYFFTNELGFTIVKIPTDLQYLSNSPMRLLKIWIKDYPKVSSFIRIKNIPNSTINNSYFPGTYEVSIPPYRGITLQMVGGGGGGGGAVNDRIGNFSVQANGENGGDSYFEYNSYKVIAGGGQGGDDGHAHNGSAYSDGEPGDGGINNITSGSIFTIVQNIKGLPGIPKRKAEPHLGGDSVSPLEVDIYNGAGGIGAVGTRWSDSGNYNYGYGGGGGSGGFIEITYRNNTPIPLVFTLVVGDKGKGWIQNNGTVGNHGEDGNPGYAKISSID